MIGFKPSPLAVVLSLRLVPLPSAAFLASALRNASRLKVTGLHKLGLRLR